MSETIDFDVDSLILAIATILIALSTSYFWNNKMLFEALVVSCLVIIIWTLDKIRRELKTIRCSHFSEKCGGD